MLYYENMEERSMFGETPYKNFNAYFTKNYDFLVNKYKKETHNSDHNFNVNRPQ